MRGHFPNDRAAAKLIYLALRGMERKWRAPPVFWHTAWTEFAIYLGERFAMVASCVAGVGSVVRRWRHRQAPPLRSGGSEVQIPSGLQSQVLADRIRFSHTWLTHSSSDTHAGASKHLVRVPKPAPTAQKREPGDGGCHGSTAHFGYVPRNQFMIRKVF